MSLLSTISYLFVVSLVIASNRLLCERPLHKNFNVIPSRYYVIESSFTPKLVVSSEFLNFLTKSPDDKVFANIINLIAKASLLPNSLPPLTPSPQGLRCLQIILS
jgi:hypothetical protein